MQNGAFLPLSFPWLIPGGNKYTPFMFIYDPEHREAKTNFPLSGYCRLQWTV